MAEAYFSGTAVGTDSGATATVAAVSEKTYVVNCISGHVDADSLLKLTDTDDNVLWESKIDVSAEGFSFHFPGLMIPFPKGDEVNGIIASSSADCQVMVCGFSI